jgi:putative transposase
VEPIDLIAEHKVYRFFRARRKLIQGNLISHITQRAAGKDPCFIEDDDFLCMLGFLEASAKRYDYEVYSFCLMGNHLHLLMRPNQENLPFAMKDLFSRYAMRFNRKYERRGHLFGGPYRQAVCLDEAYLIAASIYIHLNPVKADIVSDPRDYRWSSIRMFVDGSEESSFVNAGFIMQVLADDLRVARERYWQLLEKGMALPVDYVKAQEAGVEHFKKNLMTALPSIFGNMSIATKVARIAGTDILNMQALDQRIDEAVARYGKRKPGSYRAMKFLIEQLIARGFKRSEIAERLHISPKTVYNILKKQT